MLKLIRAKHPREGIHRTTLSTSSLEDTKKSEIKMELFARSSPSNTKLLELDCYQVPFRMSPNSNR